MQSETAHPQRRAHSAPALRNYFHCSVLLLSVAAWLLAFAAQIAATKIVGRAAVGVLWFAIFLQLFLIIGVLVVLLRETVAPFHLQLAFFATMAGVFAVIGVDMSIFTGERSRDAMGAGWLVLAVVDILWVLYFSAEPGTPLAHLVEGMVFAPRQHQHQNGRAHSGKERHESGSGSGSGLRSGGAGETGFYDAEEMRSDGSPDETKVGHEGPNGAASPEKSPEWRGMDRRIVDRSQDSEAMEPEPEPETTSTNDRSQNLTPRRPPPPVSKNRRAVYVEEPRHLSTIYDNTESTSDSATRDSQPERDSAQLYPFKVRARSDWIPRSPSEISFRKGDVLHSAEKEGKKWWKVRKADGSVGSAPSNYFKVVSS
ncbi:hypothetical protein B0H17DRAFT_1326384 [Mycena rosella]|uniref:SH3 domain-containing protein n=1 Tax=Mycena rosella TaxID=1033263 RepID=A0AAD7GTA4_MYCRO|nr:hypothetical protein B0H17DRAFT_1326384 [Mycena rosella]